MNSNEIWSGQNIERVRSLVNYHAFLGILTILELALWNEETIKSDDWNPRTRVEHRVKCGGKYSRHCDMETKSGDRYQSLQYPALERKAVGVIMLD